VSHGANRPNCCRMSAWDSAAPASARLQLSGSRTEGGYRRRMAAFGKERHVRKLVIIGICAVTSCSGQPCHWDSVVGSRAGPNTVGSGNRAGAPDYYCQPGVCKSTGEFDPDYGVCLGGYQNVLPH
jgi:hypothetical protein